MAQPKRQPARPFSMRPYIAQGTMARFNNDMMAWGKAVRGPRRSGKTTGIVNELLLHMCTARILPGTNIRSSRGAFIRSTFNRLWTTTVKEWMHWVPEPITTIRAGNPPTLFVRFYNPADGTEVQAEIMIVPADDAASADQFRGAQLTWAWINEASEIRDRIVLDQLEPSIGQWPSMQDGGPVWRGVLMDTNAMSMDHWWYDLAEIIKPQKWHFYSQPPAVLYVPGTNPKQYVANMGQQNGIPAAENIRWLDGGYSYYTNLIAGKSPEWIRVFLMNEYGSLFSGKPVFWEYQEDRHTEDDLPKYGGLPLIMGVDFASKTAVALICQLDMNGQFRVLQEVIEENTNSRKFARGVLSAVIHNEYEGMHVIGVGDPSGQDGNKTNEFTDFTEFADAGIPLIPAKTNVIRHRINAVRYYLQQHNGFKASRSKAPKLCASMSGDYHWQPEEVESGDPKPAKTHPASDLCDCLAYACLEARGVSSGSTFRVDGKTHQEVKGQFRPVNPSGAGDVYS